MRSTITAALRSRPAQCKGLTARRHVLQSTALKRPCALATSAPLRTVAALVFGCDAWRFFSFGKRRSAQQVLAASDGRIEQRLTAIERTLTALQSSIARGVAPFCPSCSAAASRGARGDKASAGGVGGGSGGRGGGASGDKGGAGAGGDGGGGSGGRGGGASGDNGGVGAGGDGGLRRPYFHAAAQSFPPTPAATSSSGHSAALLPQLQVPSRAAMGPPVDWHPRVLPVSEVDRRSSHAISNSISMPPTPRTGDVHAATRYMPTSQRGSSAQISLELPDATDPAYSFWS